MDSVKIGLLGAGTISGSVIEVLQNNAEIITQRANTRIERKKFSSCPAKFLRCKNADRPPRTITTKF